MPDRGTYPTGTLPWSWIVKRRGRPSVRTGRRSDQEASGGRSSGRPGRDSRGVHDGDPVITQALGLLEKEALGLEGEALAVEEIPGDQEGVHVLPDREIDGVSERLARGVAEASPDASDRPEKKCRDVRRRRAGSAWAKLEHAAGAGEFLAEPIGLRPVDRIMFPANRILPYHSGTVSRTLCRARRPAGRRTNYMSDTTAAAPSRLREISPTIEKSVTT